MGSIRLSEKEKQLLNDYSDEFNNRLTGTVQVFLKRVRGLIFLTKTCAQYLKL
jgi:hypothetical protein